MCVAFWLVGPVEGNGDAATAASGSGIIVLSDPFRIAPVIIDNPHLLDMQPMWANFRQPCIEVNQIAVA
jgi:hypothetical protein